MVHYAQQDVESPASRDIEVMGSSGAWLQTMQCAAFLSGMVHSKLIDRALVLAPMTLLDQWAKELKVCMGVCRV